MRRGEGGIGSWLWALPIVCVLVLGAFWYFAYDLTALGALLGALTMAGVLAASVAHAYFSAKRGD